MSDQPPSQPDPDGSPPPPPPPAAPPAPDGMGAPSPGTRYGGIGRRFAARLLDGFIVGIPVAIVLVAIGGMSPTGVGYAAFTALINLGYFVWFESTTGATLGKRILALDVVATEGGRLSMERSFRRNWWLLLTIIPTVGGVISAGVAIYIAVTITNDSRNQGFHDQMADALVLER